jgi:hypothetical protein
MAADIALKLGQSADVPFALFDAAGAALDLTSAAVSLVIASRGTRLQRAGTLDSPATLGTGKFTFTPSDYGVLRVGPHTFELWVVIGAIKTPVLTGTLEVLDVPQVNP